MYIYVLKEGKTQDSWVTHGALNRLENQEHKNTKKITILGKPKR